MSGHPKAEVLSAYLDRELVGGEEARLVDHLTECARCQQRLDGLRGVVAKLHSVQTATVPQFLHDSMPHLISLEERPRNLLDRFENRLKRIHIPAASVPLIFALVMTFAVVVYFFTWGAYSSRQGATEVVVVPGGGVADDSSRTAVGECSFVLEEESWRQEGLEADSWREVDVESAEGSRILEAEPALGELLQGGRSVLLSWQGEALLLGGAAEP